MAPKGVARRESADRSFAVLNGSQKAKVENTPIKRKHNDYTSDGVSDHDIFALPSSDYQLMGLLTVVAAVVRLFRIYQPSSVVFDEVQYGILNSKLSIRPTMASGGGADSH